VVASHVRDGRAILALLQVEVAPVTVKENDARTNDEATGIEFGWQVHDALDTWTGRADTKASIVLTLEIATLGFVVALTGGKQLFATLSGWRERAFQVGLGLLVFGIVAAIGVVMPQLARRKARKQPRDGLIYFGHLRHATPSKLERTLTRLSPGDIRAALAEQLVIMSQIAWRKHSWLQVSIGAGLLAAVAFLVAGIG